MSDAALREVLRSPLDDRPPTGHKGWAGLVALVVAAACGFGAIAGWRALSGNGAEPGQSTTTATSSPGTPPGPATIGDLQAEVVAAWQPGDRLFLVVATTVLPGSDPEEVAALPSAHWVLRLGSGDLLPAAVEVSTFLAPGLFTLEFPRVDISGGAELLAYPVEEEVEGTFTTSLASARFPWQGLPQGTSYRLGGEEIAIDSIRLDDAGGELAWHLAGDSTARAVVSAGATYDEAGAGPQALVTEPELPYAYMLTRASAPPVARSGKVQLFHLDSVEAPSHRSRFFGDPERAVDVAQLELGITVRLYLYSAVPVGIPVALPVVEAG